MKSLISVKETKTRIGVGSTTTWKLIKNKRLDVVRIGRRTLVTSESVDRLIDGG